MSRISSSASISRGIISQSTCWIISNYALIITLLGIKCRLMRNLDNKDQQIIRTLQRNGRMTNQDLAAEVNLSPSPCLRRLKLLEQNGVITGYSANIDAEAYGLPVTVFVHIKLESHTEETVAKFETDIARIDQVMECFVMTGASDYLLRVVVADLSDYEDFVRRKLHSIGSIASMDSSFVYGVVKKTNVFPTIG
ncbi:Leucine-responsive regulatory protein [Roseovarius aestuarii]|uniref:Leucine-responsive regulatory protein n=1 Tax=Roseovarius aestuarii TaxID=475083 RepID=A0A1X7BTV6_9RHOB|nr:Leucine-responsive regulatory protein [Roseovarius aestuarii]